ncbi:unnamed protein product [Clonostachys solani]|uniref:Heterokaryon incompatibility domain-containing protein n=1 Tax=Clonostachys solani TaxID=160281 RepID=A0A9N9Z4X5_9HYPO|nr:unnamed protein product [Clonostachys solani]
MSETADLSVLCRVCLSALYSERDSSAAQRDFHIYRRHHQTLDSFLRAAREKCAVCRVVYENVKRKLQNLSTKTPSETASTMIRMRRKEDLQGPQLVIIFLKDGSHIETKFQLFPTSEHMTARFFPPLSLQEAMHSARTLDLLSNWYRACHSSHSRCIHHMARGAYWLPSRVLDIGNKHDKHWRLAVPSQDHVANAPYVTLSYRWGHNPNFQLLRSTFDQFRREQQISELPKTFQDAIVVTRELSVRYLWIDAVCIIQDSSEDKAHEIPQMGSIYNNAACNLAASASEDAHGGLFRARDTTAIAPALIEAPAGAIRSERHYIIDMSYRDRQLLGGPLHKRGWVFQERFLSKRVIYFSESQIFWECLSELKCEGFPNGIPLSRSAKNMEPLWNMVDGIDADASPFHKDSLHKGLPGDKAMSAPILHLWNSLVCDYSACDLTFPSDRLLAFEGIADLFRQVTGGQYLAGLWHSNLLHLLDWWVDKPRIRRSPEYRAPSWSWASLDGPVRARSAVALSAFLVSNPVVVESPEYGVGHLRLNIVSSLTLYADDRRPMHCVLHPDSLGTKFDAVGTLFFLPLQTTCHDSAFYPPGKCDLATHATEVSCLLLEPVLCSEPVVYRRVGHCVVSHPDDISWLGLQVDQKSGLAVIRQDTSSAEITIV